MPEWLKTPWIQDLWTTLSTRLPTLGIALVILIGGWLAAYIVQKIVLATLKRTTIDDKIAGLLGFDARSAPEHAVERAVSKAVYYLALVFVLVAFFGYLQIDAVTKPLLTLLDGFAGAVPNLFKAFLLGFGGLLLASGARRVVLTVLDKIGLERRMQRLTGEAPAREKEPAREREKEGKKKKAPRPEQPLAATLADVVYWVVIAVVAIPVLEALQIGALASPLSSAFGTVTTYLPRVAAAAILLVAGYIAARVVRAVVAGALAKVGVDRAMFRLGLGAITKDQPLSRILGSVAMAFVLLHFAISAVGRLEIAEVSVPLGLMLGRIYAYLPKLLVGATLMVVGVVVARVAGNVSARLLSAMGFNTLMTHIGIFKEVSAEAKQQEDESRRVLDERVKGAGGTSVDEEEPDELLAKSGTSGVHTPADVGGLLVSAVLVLLFLRQVLGTMELDGLAILLDRLIVFLPQVLAAGVILGAGLWAGRYVRARVDELTSDSTDRLTRSLGAVAHGAIVVFTAMMALQQLGVGSQLIGLSFGLLLGALCLSLALSFGLGGRELAGQILRKEYERRQKTGGSTERKA